MKTFAKSILALAPLALLAACSGDEPAPPPPADNGEEMMDVTNEAIGVPEAPLVMNAPIVATNDTAVEEPAPVAEDEQIRADADATGMTSRVNRDEDEAPAINESATVSEEK